MHPSTRLDKHSCQSSLPLSSWSGVLDHFVDGFTRPSFALFCKLVMAWIICPGRHTTTRLYLLAEPEGDRAHDAYHRFLREGAWRLEHLWRTTTVLLVQTLCPRGRVHVAIDDTIFRKWGRKVEGSGRYKDPVRSLGRSVVYMSGLNFVCLTLLVSTSWGTLSVALPIGERLYRKRGSTHVELATEMLTDLAAWLPNREFAVVADGAYCPLARAPLTRTVVVSRARMNAELYDPEFPQSSPRRPGRPRQRGNRLPSPAAMAADPSLPWRVCRVRVRGRVIERKLFARRVLWWATCRQRPLLLVLVRDPAALNRDEYLFTTDVAATPESVVSDYADRWVIEVMHRDCKQLLAAETPQCWRDHGPERAGALSFLVYSLVWFRYLAQCTDSSRQPWLRRAWYTGKLAPAFSDALADVRRQLWLEGNLSGSRRNRLSNKFDLALIEALAYAA